MPNTLSSITPLLELLGREIKILPATGGAVEDLQHPDQEEIEDMKMKHILFVLCECLINRDSLSPPVKNGPTLCFFFSP